MDITSTLFTGLALGSIYGLVAIGFHITASVCGAVNFAQGSSAMLGAAVMWMLIDAGCPGWASLILSVSLCAVYGVVVERAAVRPFLRRRSDAWLMATVALGLICDNGMTFVFGAEPRAMPSPFTGSSVRLAGSDLGIYPLHIIIPAVMLSIAAALDCFRRKTLVGIAMLASAQNQDAARIVGIPVPTMVTSAFALASALAAIGGIMLAPLSNVDPGMGVVLGLKAFAVAILGGLGSAWGIVVGALLFGVAEAAIGLALGTGFTTIATFTFIIAALAIRPNGLLGRAQVRKA